MTYRREEGETAESQREQRFAWRWLYITFAVTWGASLLAVLTVRDTRLAYGFFVLPIVPFFIGLRHFRAMLRLQKAERIRTQGRYEGPAQWIINEHPVASVLIFSALVFILSIAMLK